MSRKDEMRLHTEIAEHIYSKAMREFHNHYRVSNAVRLRTCTACVWETEHYYLLQSYNTFVAVIEKSSDTLADCLRTVYGYTATSSQHVRKFEKDYGRDKWGCRMVYTAR